MTLKKSLITSEMSAKKTDYLPIGERHLRIPGENQKILFLDLSGIESVLKALNPI